MDLLMIPVKEVTWICQCGTWSLVYPPSDKNRPPAVGLPSQLPPSATRTVR